MIAQVQVDLLDMINGTPGRHANPSMLDPDGQAFAAVFVQDVQRPESFAVIRSAVDEVVRSDMIGVFGSEPHT